MTELKNIQLKPAVEMIRYSEPKILGYLATTIITFLILIILMFSINLNTQNRLSNIETILRVKVVPQLEELKTTTVEQFHQMTIIGTQENNADIP